MPSLEGLPGQPSIDSSLRSPSGAVRLPISWELFVLGVAVMSVLNLVLYVLVRSDAVAQAVAIVDIGITFIFVADFLTRFALSRNRRWYMFHGYGWLDLLSCIPGLRVIRFVRVVSVWRRIRATGGLAVATDVLLQNRARAVLLVVVLLTVGVIEYGSMAMLAVEENAPGANITTASDSLWFLVVTISTIGYGDEYPVTNLGRVVGTFILITGVALFTTLTGYLAHFFYSAGTGQGHLLSERRRERLRRRIDEKAAKEEEVDNEEARA